MHVLNDPSQQRPEKPGLAGPGQQGRSRMPKGWHKEDIKAAIRKRGISMQELARSNNLPVGACAMALFRPYFAAELVIAEFLRVSPRQLWPQRYNTDGAYLHPKSRTNHTRKGRVRECQNGAAA